MSIIFFSLQCGMKKYQLRIVPKSEAAFAYCRYMHLEDEKREDDHEFKKKLIPGFMFMVIRIGGNTHSHTHALLTILTSKLLFC